MMQQVATTKSEVAAIAANSKTELQFESDSNQDFERMLQDQQGQPYDKDQLKSTPVVDSKPGSQASQKNALKETVTKLSGEKQSADSSETKQSANDDLALKQQVAEKEGELYIKDEPSLAEFVTEPFATKNELEQDLATIDVDDKSKAQEWVSLVENLQKLSQQAQSENTTKNDIPVIGESVSDEALSSAERSMLEESAVGSEIATTGLGNDDANTLLPGKASTQKDLPITAQALADWLQNTLDNLLSNVESKEGNSQDLSEQSLSGKDILSDMLKQPAKLQEIFSKVAAEVDNLASTSELSLELNMEEQKASSKAIDILPDLSTEENQSLLAALLTDMQINDNDDLADISNNLEMADDDVMSDLLAAETDIAIEPVVIDLQSEIDAVPQDVVKNPTMLTLANLPEAKLDKVLTNIAERLLGKSITQDNNSKEQTDGSRSIETLDIASAVVSPVKEFVASLKAGITEFKTQLAQGREPGLDLKSLLSDSMDKLSSIPPTSKVVEGTEQIINGFSQVLDFAASLNRALEQQGSHQGQTYTAAQRDVAQLHGEQVKQSQLTQFESKFDKAVNIAKPEGLQQLAEKVRWMANTKNLVAEIRLDPAELGSVHVKVAMQGETASVSFVVQSQQAKDAMDGATVRLRDMLAEKGIELGQSSVRQESSGQQEGNGEQLAGKQHSAQTNIEDESSLEQGVIHQQVVNGALGGIDYFV